MIDTNTFHNLSIASESARNRYVSAAEIAADILLTNGETATALRRQLRELRLIWLELARAASAAALSGVR